MKKIISLSLVVAYGMLSSGYAKDNNQNVNQNSITEVHARLGVEIASKTFDKVGTIIKVLPQEKETALKSIKSAFEKVSKTFSDAAKREQLEKFFEEISKLENPSDEVAVRALFEKYPVAKEVQASENVESFIAGVAMVLADRCGIATEDALMIARVLFPLFLPR